MNAFRPLVLLLLLSTAACQAQWETLRPRLEGTVEQVVTPPPGELPQGWDWHTATVGEMDVTIVYGPLDEPPPSCIEAPLCLRLLHPVRAAADDRLTDAFAIRTVAAAAMPPGALDAIVAGLVARLDGEGRGRSLFWEARATWALVLLQGALALLLLLAVAAIERRSLPWRAVAGGAALTAVAFALRWFLPPVAVFHENHHGLAFLDTLRNGGLPVHHVLSASLALLQLPATRWAWSDGTILAVQAVLSALSVPLFGTLAARLFRSPAVGWLAAILWAVTPLAIRMAPTESLFGLTTLLLPAVALTLAAGLERGPTWRGIPWLLLAIVLGALLGQTRVLPLLFVVPAWLLGMAASRLDGRARKGALAAVVLATGLLLLPQALDILAAAEQRGPEARFIALENLGRSLLGGRLLLLRPTWVAPTVLPLALVGLAVAWRRDRGRGALLAAATAALLLAVGLVSTCTSLHLELEVPLVGLVTLLAAPGILALSGLLAGDGGWLSAWRRLVVGLVGATVLLPAGVVRFEPPDGQEYRFIEEEVLPRLRKRAAPLLVPLPAAWDSGRVAIPSRWWEDQVPGLRLRDPAGTLSGPERPLVYRGLAALCRGGDRVGRSADGLPQFPGARLVPVLERAVEPPPGDFLCVELPEGPVTIGLYALEAVHPGVGGN